MPPITADLPTWNFRPGDPPEYRKLGKTWFVAAGSLLLSSHRSKWWNHFAQPHQDGLPSLLHSILHRSAAPCWKILWVLKKPEFAAQKGCGNASTYHYQDNMSKQFVLESLRRLLLHSPLQRNRLQFSTYMCPHTNLNLQPGILGEGGSSRHDFPKIHSVQWSIRGCFPYFHPHPHCLKPIFYPPCCLHDLSPATANWVMKKPGDARN